MSQAVEAVAPRKEVTGLHRMTETGLRDLCRKNKLYQTPRLNDVLYLHYQGYQYIECLDEYTELKCLWLECNAISEIEGLDKLSKLKCLFLQNNLIKRIDNLASCPELDTLNLSSNHIRKIENIGSDILPVLNTLNISTNYLKDSESLAHLVDCKTLAVLDLSNNRIDDILVVKIFEKMPCLKVLVLQGNPVVSRLPQYRKTLILACKELTYLDSRPVFPRDRACAEAWKRDGYEGERKENMRWNRADRKKMRDSVNYTIKLRNRHRPAEEQAALISSTDSEGEKDADKGAEKTRLKAELEYGCVDDIWSEVSGDNKDNDSSGSSGTADEPTDSSQAEDIAEQLSSRQAKPLEGRPKVLHESEFDDEKNTKKAEVSPRVIAEPEEAVNKGQELRRGKRMLIEEVKLDELDVECKKVKLQTEKANNGEEEKEEKPTVEDVQVKADEEIKSESTKAETIQLPELIAEPDSDSELDQSTAAALKESCEKLGAIALNDLSEPTPEQIKQEAIDRMYGSYGSEIFAEQPEFDEAMLENKSLHFNSELQVNSGESLRPQVNLIDNKAKTQDQLEYEEECNEANDIVEYNLDELSTHLDEDLDELRQPLEELRGPPVDNIKESTSSSDEEKEADKKKCVELTTVVRSLRIIEEFSVRRERICEEIKDQEKKAKEEQANKTLIEEIEQEESDKQVEAELDAMDAAFAKMLDDCSDDVAKRVYGAGLDKPSYEWHKEECMRQLTITEKRTIVNEDEYKMRPINEQTSAEQAEFICEQMSQKLAEDEASMRELLQELEDEVDVLSDVTDTLQDEFALEFPEPPVEEVCVSLLDGLIDELQYQEIISGQNIKCFDFGLIESDEEYSYSADPKVDAIVPPDLEDPAGGKSLRECIDAFGDFLSSVNDRKTEWKLDKKRTISGDKVQAAKELLKSRMMTAYQAETPEELIAKLAKQEEKTKRRVAAMTERCFDKRQNLEDSLEVIDNKLVIVKKDTGLVEDLPPPPALISDSEIDTESESSDADGDDDYDTAEEVNEEPRLQTARAANARGNWPKAELTECEALQSKDKAALEEIRDEDSVPDQSIDEFYSLEARAAFNSLDSEFLDKLDLQKVIGSDGEITVEGMRNYDRLKDSIKPESVKNVENPDTALVEQDEMLKDLIERKRLQEERERQLQELASSQDLAPHKLKSKEITDKLEGEIVEEKCLTEIREGMQKLLGNKDEPKELLAQAEIKAETEINSEQQEEERELEDLTHAENLGAIQLTLGSCKLYELKSQLPENHGEEEANTAAKEAEERSDKETETLKTEVLESANDKAEDADIKQTNATNNLSIDEDIISDNPTDYESGEDIPVVEPPKLPEGALNELFSNEIEDKGLQLERENEEALRKEIFSLPLRAWASQELTTESEENLEIGNEKPDAELASADVDAEFSEVIANKANENEEETDSEANGAIGELARNAKRQWAKISQKLNEFIAADDIELLDKGQFNEDTSYDEDDDELEASLKQMNALYKGCDKEVKESIKGDKDEATEEDGKQDLKIEEIERNLEEELQKNKIAEELDSEKQTSEENDKNLEELSANVQQEMESLEKTIDATKDRICEDIKECEQTKNDNNNPSNKPTIRLDYFEPDKVDFIDADFDEAAELKTDEIECNLEILNEDGDAVVQEVSVNAQVTYEFK